MIIKTIEFVPSDITLTIETLQADINAGKYDDILSNYSFYIITEKGLTLVKKENDIISIVPNATIDMSNIATKDDISNLLSETELNNILANKNYLTTIPDEYITETELDAKGYLTEHQNLDNYVTKNDIPTFSFDGTTLVVTINGVSNRYIAENVTE